MSKIIDKVTDAFTKFYEDGDVIKLVETVADVADRSVNCAGHAAIMYEAIRNQRPHKVLSGSLAYDLLKACDDAIAWLKYMDCKGERLDDIEQIVVKARKAVQ